MESKEAGATILPAVINEDRRIGRRMFANGSTVWGDVETHQTLANTDTPAASASNMAMARKVALSRNETVYGT